MSKFLMRSPGKTVVHFVLASLVYVVVQLAHAQDVRSVQSGGVITSIRALGDIYPLTKDAKVSSDNAQIIFYRTTEGTQDNAASVFVNGMYHASIVAGGYSPICLNTGEIVLGVRQMRVANGPKDGLDTKTIVDAKPGTTIFVKVQESEGPSWILQPVSEQVAQQELSNTKLQLHTISRVIGAKACDSKSNKVNLNLPGDTLFTFGRSDRAALTGQGVAALDAVVEQIKNEFVSVDKIKVVGHADPLGHAANNAVLSEARAQTVLKYITEKGLSATTLESLGMGDRDLIIATCDRQINPQSIACNQPNRRVVIELSGLPR